LRKFKRFHGYVGYVVVLTAIKDFFEQDLAATLGLQRVTTPLFVRSGANLRTMAAPPTTTIGQRRGPTAARASTATSYGGTPSMGGRIGQSRMCMFFLRTEHVGEISVGIWPVSMQEACAKTSIPLL
jgi:asparagine synthetase A